MKLFTVSDYPSFHLNPTCSSWHAYITVFDRRRRDPLWKITEKLSGEDKITKRAVHLFYEQIDYLIGKRLDAMREGYKPDPDAGVDLLDLFLQSTTDKYTLGGMVFSFLSAGRKSQSRLL